MGRGAEIVKQTRIGYTYQSVDDAADKVKKALETPNSPYEISRKARIFSSESFEESIQRIVKDDVDSRSRQHRRQGIAPSTTLATFPDAA